MRFASVEDLKTIISENCDKDTIPIQEVMDIIEMPTIDIVRCKECMHLQKNGQCDKTSLWIGNKEDGGCDDFFCGYGEPREIF